MSARPLVFSRSLYSFHFLVMDEFFHFTDSLVLCWHGIFLFLLAYGRPLELLDQLYAYVSEWLRDQAASFLLRIRQDVSKIESYIFDSPVF